MVSKVFTYLRKRGIAVAFVALAVAGAVAIDSSAKHEAKSSALVVYDSQLAACHRGNTLRTEINHRVGVVGVQRQVLLQFIESAEAARLSSYANTHQATDKIAADEYASLANQVRTQIHYGTVPIIDCERAIKKP